jgi:hypothetical protein
LPKRETVFASAILAALVPAMVLSVGLHHAQGAADNCLAKPTAAPPQRSHWYYRVDQAGNRRCWFLAREDATPRQALSPKLAPNPPPKRASQPKATATAQPVAREMDPAATYAMLSPSLPTSADVVDGEQASASNGAAGGLAAMHPEDDMPLIGPVLGTAELAAAERPTGLAARLGPMLAYVAAALALVIIVRKVFRWFAVRRLRRRRVALREQWNQELQATRQGGPVSPAFADVVAALRPTRHRRKLVAVPRIAEIARPPADEWDPDHDIEALEAEESLRQFLPRWRRVAA